MGGLLSSKKPLVDDTRNIAYSANYKRVLEIKKEIDQCADKGHRHLEISYWKTPVGVIDILKDQGYKAERDKELWIISW